LPQRWYVERNGTEIDANLPSAIIICKGACGNALYFTSDRTIYMAVFKPANKITISHVREAHDNEDLTIGKWCRRNGKSD
ncbi:hypothetical protein PENTCL1PPCAC_8799, partial [Pristionchus entomophagus]